MLEVVLNILQVHLFVLEVVIDAQVFHVLPAQESQVVERAGHVHDGFANLAQTQSYLEVLVSTLIARRELALAH